MNVKLTAGITLGAAAAALILMIVMSGPSDDTRSDSRDRDKRLEKLRSVPYTSVTPHEVDASVSGVRFHRQGDTHDGYNLYCPRNLPEVVLMDMAGETVHKWIYGKLGPYGSIHAVMLDNGDAIVLGRTTGIISMIKIAWDSRLIWKFDAPVHHEIALLPDGSFYTFVQDVQTHRGLEVDFSFVCLYSSAGVELQRWSLRDRLDDFSQALDRSSFLDTVLDSMYAAGDSIRIQQDTPENLKDYRKKWQRPVYDYFHPNAISVLPDTPLSRRDRRFRAGNLMVCFRNVNQIAILDKESCEVLWAWGEDILDLPHHPTMLHNGNILVFNNGVEKQSSTVIELDPFTKEIKWEYGVNPSRRFYSFSKGSAQRLPNGNTLICDSDNGHAFEVTGDREIVWEWFGPVDEKSRRVQIYRMERLERSLIDPLLATSP